MQICPFPFHAIRQAVDRYPNAQISWVQVCRAFFFVLQRWSNLHVPIAYVHLPGGTEESRRMVLCGAQVSEWRLRLQAAVAASVDTVDHRVFDKQLKAEQVFNRRCCRCHLWTSHNVSVSCILLLAVIALMSCHTSHDAHLTLHCIRLTPLQLHRPQVCSVTRHRKRRYSQVIFRLFHRNTPFCGIICL